MKLIKAKIKNFRLLYDVDITFDKNTTSIVGKNNSGKTSLSVIFNIFLNKLDNAFSFDDFSLESHQKFIEIYKSYSEITEENKEEQLLLIQKNIPKIQLFLTLQYDEKDNWANLIPFFTSLEEGNELVLLFEYAPDSTEKFLKALQEAMSSTTPCSNEELILKIKSHYENHYKINIRPYSEDEEADSVSRSDINRLIQSKFISAQRTLDDSDAESKSRLSRIIQDQFKNENERDEKKSKELLKALEKASESIDGELADFFSSFVTYFKTFGFPGVGREKVELKSQLEPAVLFRNNIKLFYNHDGKSLPERYNGLGYSNLLCIIAEIMGFYSKIKEVNNNLNIIFIEEPEAHMHPQMQSVFIKKIVYFLNQVGLDAQIIITTHSSYILAASNLESIRYFKQKGTAPVAIVKDLMTFNQNFTVPETKKFLQQYLTLGKCDLFFADKAILFEGTVERILLPVFIKKIESRASYKLLEQYISSVEVGGAYISKFKELLEFLELKTLVITDIDSVDKEDNFKKAEVKSGEELVTSNVTLKTWIPAKDKIDDLLRPDIIQESSDGLIRTVYQKNVNPENEPLKCGRSFEEAFIIENTSYIFANKEKLLSIKNHLNVYQNSDAIYSKSYEIQDFIDRNDKKTEFAFDLLNIKKDSWKVPSYIEEGLIWLAQ